MLKGLYATSEQKSKKEMSGCKPKQEARFGKAHPRVLQS